jgi:hypothetical protein
MEVAAGGWLKTYRLRAGEKCFKAGRPKRGREIPENVRPRVRPISYLSRRQGIKALILHALDLKPLSSGSDFHTRA